MAREGPLVCFAPRREPDARLVCIPYAGGNALGFRDWAPALGESIEVWACELPGHGRRISEAPLSSIDSAADEIEAALWPLLDRPCAVFGHSMGALIGYQLMRQLTATGATVLHFFASACSPPDRSGWLPRVRDLPADDVLSAVQELGGIPLPLIDDSELRALFAPVLRAELAACEEYTDPGDEPLPCAITALASDRDTLAPRTAVERWRARTAGAFRVELFRGGHFFVDSERDAVTRLVRTTLLSAVSRMDGTGENQTV